MSRSAVRAAPDVCGASPWCVISSRARSISRFILLGLTLVVVQAPECRAQNADSSSDGDSEVVFSETVESGMLFLNGKYVPPPITVEATRRLITVNGQPYAVKVEAASHESSAWGDGSRDRRGRARGESENQNDGRVDQGSFPAPRRNPDRPAIVPSVRSARNLVEWLTDEILVVAFENRPVRLMNTASQEFDLFDALLAKSATPEQTAAFLTLAGSPEDVRVWTDWLQSYVPDQAAGTLMQSRVDEILSKEQEAVQKQVATRRLDLFAYPLTLAGMVLSVIAFGHMLKWTTRGHEQKADVNPEAVHYVVVALWLMLGMSVIDLTWTILAGQAGTMKEVNPLAARLIHSPLQLAVFKVVATIIGFGILYAWRQRRQMQQATWWMCLVSVLLTFRWVIFDSMMNQ